jgi:hypothetical protein
MTAITTLRASLAAALVDNTLYSTYAFPPATPSPNSVIVTPADPYIEPNNNLRNNINPKANFRVQILLPLLDNEGNLNGIETTVVAVFNKLAASSLNLLVGTVSAPSVLSIPSGDLLTCDISVSAFTEWE